MDIENLLNDLRQRGLEHHEAQLIDDLVRAITELTSNDLGQSNLTSIFNDISYTKIIESVSEDIANSLIRHGEERINAALKDMVPNSLVIMATVAQFALM